MHPVQASLLAHADRVAAKTSEGPKFGAAALFKYTCPETGKDFYLTEKKTTVKSPYTGKSFGAKPEKDTLSDVGKEMKEDAAKAKAQKSKKAALLSYLRSSEG